MGIANIDKGKLRRLTASIDAEGDTAANTRILTIKVIDAYGTPVVDAPGTAAAAAASVISNQSGPLVVEVVFFGTVANLTLGPSGGGASGAAFGTVNTLTGAKQAFFTANSSGVLKVSLANTTGAETSPVVVRCGSDTIALNVAFAA